MYTDFPHESSQSVMPVFLTRPSVRMTVGQVLDSCAIEIPFVQVNTLDGYSK